MGYSLWMGSTARALAMLGTIVGLSLWPGESEACSGPVSCSLAPPAELGKSGLPANAPGIVVHPGQWEQDAGATLLREDGGMVPVQSSEVPWTTITSPIAILLTPTTPLVVGERYVASNNCGQRQLFEVSASRPLPTSLGTVSVTTGREVIEVGGGSLCSISHDAAVARLTIVPSAELAPFSGVVGWTLEVDGRVWARERFGGISPAGVLETYPNFPQRPNRRVDLVYATCKPSGEAGGGAGRGAHTATLRAELAGGGSLPPVEVSFTLDCGVGGGCSCGAADSAAGAWPFVGLALLLIRSRGRAVGTSRRRE